MNLRCAVREWPILHAALVIGLSTAGGCTAPASTAPASTTSASTASAATIPAPTASAAPPRPVALGADMTVDRERQEVIIQAWVAATEGWLEQAVCGANTREHESLLVVRTPASRVHAALLLVGVQPGHPGSWRMQDQPSGPATVQRVPPAGPSLDIFVRRDGVDVPLTAWMKPAEGRPRCAEHPWVFAGSQMRPNTRSMGPGEHYVADFTGSVVGIVTFGDEVVAFDEVLSDQAEVDSPLWLANTAAMPASGTEVQLVIRPRPQPGPRMAP